MADFCKQCALVMFGIDHGDLAELSTKEQTEKGMYPVALCERCGPIQVDHTGTCVSKDCYQNGHEEADDGD